MPRRTIDIFNRSKQHFTPLLDAQLEKLVKKTLEEMNDPVLSRFTNIGREFLLYGLLAATRKRVVNYDGDDYTIWPAQKPKIFKTAGGVLAVSDDQRNVYVRHTEPEKNNISLLYTLEESGYKPGEVDVPRQGENERFATAYLEELFKATKRFSEEANTYPLRPVAKPSVLIENVLLIPGRDDVTFYLEERSGRPNRMKPIKRRGPKPPLLRLIQG